MNNPNALPAVYDCMIFLQATINDNSPAAELLRRVEQGNVVLFISEAILSEVRDVLTRPDSGEKPTPDRRIR